MKYSVHPKNTFQILLYAIILLLALHIIGQFLFHHYPTGPKSGKIARMTSFNGEVNIPTLFSAFLLFFSALLLLIVSSFKRKSGQPYTAWYILCLVFCFLAVDEAISIHEMFSQFARSQFGLGGIFYYGWIIPYGAALLVLVGMYVPFLKKLPKDIAMLFVASGFIFVLGAVGFEMLGGKQEELYGAGTMLYIIYFTIEELLEMTGISLFIFALLKYISNHIGKIRIAVTTPEKTTELLNIPR